MRGHFKMDKKNEVLIYEDKDGLTKVNVTFTEDDVWLTQSQLAEIYKTTRENVTMHISNIYKTKELPKEATSKKFLLVQNEGGRRVRRNIDHYNLDMIIALGYRVQSEVAIRFRKWATKRLHEYIQKGFIMDDERLKQGGNRYFRELLQRIRDIRSSERNFYLSKVEIQRLNLLVSQFLDYAELQALEQRSMRMNDWIEELDNQILLNKRKLLEGNGKISRSVAINKATKEFEIYRKREMQELKSDFDLFVKSLRNKNKE